MDLLNRIRDTFAAPIASPAVEMAASAIPDIPPVVPLHPYYPINVEIVGYLANKWDTLTLVSCACSRQRTPQISNING
jgi:cholestenol delta-isomerase